MTSGAAIVALIENAPYRGFMAPRPATTQFGRPGARNGTTPAIIKGIDISWNTLSGHGTTRSS